MDKTSQMKKSNSMSLRKKLEMSESSAFEMLKSKYLTGIKKSSKHYNDQMPKSGRNFHPNQNKFSNNQHLIKSARQELNIRPSESEQSELTSKRKNLNKSNHNLITELSIEKNQTLKLAKWFDASVSQAMATEKSTQEKYIALTYVLDTTFKSLIKTVAIQSQDLGRLLKKVWENFRNMLKCNREIIQDYKDKIENSNENYTKLSKLSTDYEIKIKELLGNIKKKDESIFNKNLDIKYLKERKKEMETRYEKLQLHLKEFKKTPTLESEMDSVESNINECIRMINTAADCVKQTRELFASNRHQPPDNSFYQSMKHTIYRLNNIMDTKERAVVFHDKHFKDLCTTLKSHLNGIIPEDTEDGLRAIDKQILKFVRKVEKNSQVRPKDTRKMISSVYKKRHSSNKTEKLNDVLFRSYLNEYDFQKAVGSFEETISYLSQFSNNPQVGVFLKFLKNQYDLVDLDWYLFLLDLAADSCYVNSSNQNLYIPFEKSLEISNSLLSSQLPHSHLEQLKTSFAKLIEVHNLKDPDALNFDLFAEKMLECFRRLRQQTVKYLQSLYCFSETLLSPQDLSKVYQEFSSLEPVSHKFTDPCSNLTDISFVVYEIIKKDLLRLRALPDPTPNSS